MILREKRSREKRERFVPLRPLQEPHCGVHPEAGGTWLCVQHEEAGATAYRFGVTASPISTALSSRECRCCQTIGSTGLVIVSVDTLPSRTSRTRSNLPPGGESEYGIRRTHGRAGTSREASLPMSRDHIGDTSALIPRWPPEQFPLAVAHGSTLAQTGRTRSSR
jgi:hypothetical protein